MLVAKVSQKDVPIEIQVIGNVEAYSTITIKAQVGGQLTNVYFREGDLVKKGDRLFTIDPRPYQAQINQIEANIVRCPDTDVAEKMIAAIDEVSTTRRSDGLLAAAARTFRVPVSAGSTRSFSGSLTSIL